MELTLFRTACTGHHTVAGCTATEGRCRRARFGQIRDIIGNRATGIGHKTVVDQHRGAGAISPARSDDQLWSLAVAGDAEAFGDLFVRHQPAVYTFCFRRTSSWSVAEDLVSSVFLEVWRTRRPLDLDRGTLLPWLIGVATRITGRHQRSAVRRERMLRTVTDQRDPEPASLDTTVAQRVDDERRMTEVLAAVRLLPKADQDVIAACAFAGLDYAEAALALDIPVGTVKSRLSRARRRLAGSGAARDSPEEPNRSGELSCRPQQGSAS